MQKIKGKIRDVSVMFLLTDVNDFRNNSSKVTRRGTQTRKSHFSFYVFFLCANKQHILFNFLGTTIRTSINENRRAKSQKTFEKNNKSNELG